MKSTKIIGVLLLLYLVTQGSKSTTLPTGGGATTGSNTANNYA